MGNLDALGAAPSNWWREAFSVWTSVNPFFLVLPSLLHLFCLPFTAPRAPSRRRSADSDFRFLPVLRAYPAPLLHSRPRWGPVLHTP